MPKKILYVVLFFLFSCKKKDTDTFITDLSANTKVNFNKIKYINDKAVIVGGERFDIASIYLLNPNNSVQQIELPSNSTHKEIYGLDISATGKIIAVGYDASVYVSDDSGTSWAFIQNGIWKNFVDISFRDLDTCFVISSQGFSLGGIGLLDKNGNGKNILKDVRNFSLDDIDFVSDKIGYICGYGAILKTIDGGITWSFTEAKNDYFKSMSWKNELEGIAVGYAGSILQTNDGGNTWNTNRNGNNFLKKKYHFTSIEFNQVDSYIAVGDKGVVVISNDNGNNWNEIKNFTSKDLKGLCFKAPTECCIVGSEGGVFLLKI